MAAKKTKSKTDEKGLGKRAAKKTATKKTATKKTVKKAAKKKTVKKAAKKKTAKAKRSASPKSWSAAEIKARKTDLALELGIDSRKVRVVKDDLGRLWSFDHSKGSRFCQSSPGSVVRSRFCSFNSSRSTKPSTRFTSFP